MKHSIPSIIIGLFVLISPASGRIGETPQQCEQRYGKPVKLKGASMDFKKGGWLLFIKFYEGKADQVIYRKVEQNVLGMGEYISDNEFEQMLGLNGYGKDWKKVNEISMNRAWQTEDGEFYAQYKTMDHLLMIVTKGNIARYTAATKEKENKGLNGL